MTVSHSQNSSTSFIERRTINRRTILERRCDRRLTSNSTRSLRAWFQKFINPRLGVDRRKGSDRRSQQLTINRTAKSLLTPEEIADLLE